jgi:hypothetical protein
VIGSTIAVLLCQVLPSSLYVRRDLKRRAAANRDEDEAAAAAGPPEGGIEL